MNMKGLGVLMCLVLCARPAAAQVFATVGASTRGGDVAHNGLGVASSDYQATVNGRVEQAHAQSITSGGAQPMADTQGFGDFTQAGGSGQVFYTFSVAGPGPNPVPVIIRAAVHADTHGQATAAANFDWQYNLWAHRGVNVHGNQSADSSFYEHTALAPGFSQAFTVNASGRVDFWFGWGTGYQGEFQAIADPEVYIDPTFPDKDKYSIVFSPDLFPPGEPRCDISPVDSFTVMPGMPITFTVTGTAATAGETVTLNSTNLPSGVTVDGTWPASDVSAVSRTFHWTPTAGELGTPIY